MEKERRRLYAFVDDVVEPIGSPRFRKALHLDCVLADPFDNSSNAIDFYENISLVRAVTTHNRFMERFETENFPQIGDWLEIWLEDKPNNPRAWELRAPTYIPEKPTNLIIARNLRRPALSDSVVRQKGASAADLDSACKIINDNENNDKVKIIEFYFKNISEMEFNICALDVGQASCNALVSNNRIFGYFDVGAPIWLNQKSLPRVIPNPPAEGFVILSHWDFDHFELARRITLFQNLDWFAPDQPVGPNTRKFQTLLGAKLNFLRNEDYLLTYKSIELNLSKGLGKNIYDRNLTGYSLRLNNGIRNCLLTGDLDYEMIKQNQKTGLNGLIIPHHGGYAKSNIPTSLSPANAVASYGTPNKYKHPDETRLSEHESEGWKVLRTSKHNYLSRGNRWIYKTTHRNHSAIQPHPRPR